MNHPQFTPKNTILLFDLHHVLFSPCYVRMLITGIKNIYLIRLLRPAIIKKTVNLLLNKGSGQELLVFLEDQYPHLTRAVSGIVAICNAQKVIPVMHTLVKELKDKGYELHLASNIGETFFHDLEKQYTDFFSLFDHIKIVMSQRTMPLIRKPMPAFFTSYQSEANPHNKNVIFIDDNAMHLTAAHTLGFIPILFKNGTQLKKTLGKKGVI